MNRWPLLIFRSVGQRSVSKVKPILYMLGKGALMFYEHLYFFYFSVIQTDIIQSIYCSVLQLYDLYTSRHHSVFIVLYYSCMTCSPVDNTPVRTTGTVAHPRTRRVAALVVTGAVGMVDVRRWCWERATLSACVIQDTAPPSLAHSSVIQVCNITVSVRSPYC